MTLRSKTLIIFCVTFVGLIGVLYAASNIILLRSFAELEEQEARQDVGRVVNALLDDLAELESAARDWSAWDDTLNFVKGDNDEYITDNLMGLTFVNLHLNIMMFIDTSGQIVYGKAFDLQDNVQVSLPEGLEDHVYPHAFLVTHPYTNSSIAGIILLPEGPMLIVSQPIVTSEQGGPAGGTMIFGRYLDSTETQRLAETTRLPFTAHLWKESPMSDELESASSEDVPIVIHSLSAETLVGYAALKDVYGKPAVVLRVDMPRNIYKRGQSSISYFALLMLAAGLMFGLTNIVLLEQQVLSRLSRISKAVGDIGAHRNLSVRVAVTGQDELSSLAGVLNNTLEALQESEITLEANNRDLARRARYLEATAEVARDAASVLDPQQLLARVVTLISDRFNFYHAGFLVLDSAGEWVVLQAASSEAGQQLLARGYRLQVGQPGLVGYVAERGEPRIVDYAEHGEPRVASDIGAGPAPVDELTLPKTRSEMALPVRVGGQIVGVLDIQSERAAAFEADDQMVLQTLADQIAIALRNAQLYKTEQSRRLLAELLEQTGRELTSSLDMQQVPGRILEQLAAFVPYERGSVILRQGDELHIVAQRGFPETGRAMQLRIPIREGDVYQQVAAARQPTRVDDVTQITGWYQVDWLPVDHSWMGAPLISKDRVVGMMSLTRREVGAFTQDDALAVSAFAAQAAIALENARLYSEIAEFKSSLERTVEQRTEELHKTYQMLERLDKTKSDFIEVAAHELRTPLTVIKGYTQVLETHATMQQNPQDRLLLDGILVGVNRMHQVVNSMLDVTKIDSSSLQMRKELVPLSEIMARVGFEFEPAVRERNLTMDIVELDRLPSIYADPDLLYKVFYHLIVNAIKYTPDGGSITVTGEMVLDAEQPAVHIIVSDTGIGIDLEHREMIFEKFYQTGEVTVHSSGRTTFKGGGPGLGLAIVRGIVVAHGGQVWVESREHDEQRCPGSRFHVRLPVGKASTPLQEGEQ